MQFLLGARDVEHRPRFIEQSLARWTRTVQAAVRHGLLSSSVDVDLLARQLMINFIGVLELWIHEELDEEGCRAQSLYGSTLLVLAGASAAARPNLIERLQAIERQLPRQLESPRARGTRLRKRVNAA
jgi:hypothetical protein